MIEVPTKGTGWKMTPAPELSLAPLNDLNSAAEIRKVFESRAFSFQEIFLGIVMNNMFLQNKINFSTVYTDYYGKAYFLKPELGSITTHQDTTINVDLNESLNFFMVGDICLKVLRT